MMNKSNVSSITVMALLLNGLIVKEMGARGKSREPLPKPYNPLLNLGYHIPHGGQVGGNGDSKGNGRKREGRC